MSTDPSEITDLKIAKASTEDWCERFPEEGHSWSYTSHAGLPRIMTRQCTSCQYLSVQPVREALASGELALDPSVSGQPTPDPSILSSVNIGQVAQDFAAANARLRSQLAEACEQIEEHHDALVEEVTQRKAAEARRDDLQRRLNEVRSERDSLREERNAARERETEAAQLLIDSEHEARERIAAAEERYQQLAGAVEAVVATIHPRTWSNPTGAALADVAGQRGDELDEARQEAERLCAEIAKIAAKVVEWGESSPDPALVTEISRDLRALASTGGSDTTDGGS